MDFNEWINQNAVLEYKKLTPRMLEVATIDEVLVAAKDATYNSTVGRAVAELIHQPKQCEYCSLIVTDQRMLWRKTPKKCWVGRCSVCSGYLKDK